jgi:hypothetical protein
MEMKLLEKESLFFTLESFIFYRTEGKYSNVPQADKEAVYISSFVEWLWTLVCKPLRGCTYHHMNKWRQ